LIGLISLPFLGASVVAQTTSAPGLGSVRVEVHDPTGLPIKDATVTLTCGGSVTMASANDRGEAVFEKASAGTCEGRVESPGFESSSIAPVSIRTGTPLTLKVTLQLAVHVERVTVTPSEEERELFSAFREQITGDQLAALPEDPEELALVLRQLIGDNAEVRVNGFSGGRLPLGTQIRDIRIRYDVGTALGGNAPRVDIVTDPGSGGWRSNAVVIIRDEALSSRNAFSHERPVGRTQQYSWSLDGPLVRDRTALSLSIDGSRSMENQVIRAAVPGGVYARLFGQPSNDIRFWMGVEHEVSPAQSLRVELTRNVSEARNRGIGELDLPERAFASRRSEADLQIAHHATVGGRYLNDIRFRMAANSNNASSLTSARTIRVLDAFNTGGAQQEGGRRSRSFQLGNELAVVLRRGHQVKASVNLEASTYRSDASINALGTYIFDSLDAFEAHRPSSFTRRVGDPSYAYSMYRLDWHVRDDYRLRRNVVLNLALRHDVQTHLGDWVNFSPRIGVNWSPSTKARTALSAGLFVFHSPLTADVYGQTLLVNGLRQSDLVIANPGFPDPFSAGVAEALWPPSVIRVRALNMPVFRRYSVGVDQPIGRYVRLRGTASHEVGNHLFRSRDANAPVDGIRPDASILTLTQLESTARSSSDSLQTNLSVAYPRRRLSANVTYTLGRAKNDADSAFALPPDSFDLSREWGPARNDVRHWMNASVMSDLPGRLRVNATFFAQSAPPYNITTGGDANADGVYSERPEGVTRNTGRAAGSKSLDLTLTWAVLPLRTGNQAAPASTAASVPVSGTAAFRLELFVSATNVLNLVNPQNFSGVMTSPYFGQPMAAGAARHIAVGARAWF